MKLTDLRIMNFRSARLVNCTFDRIAVLLGPNNHGKSNALAAIEFLLTPGMKLTDQDFFSQRSPDDNRLTAEGTFVDLTEQEATTFKKYVHSDGSLTIQRWATLGHDGSVETGYRGYLEQPREWWLQDSAYDRLRSREAVEEASKEIAELAILLEGGGRFTKDRITQFQTAYISEHREDLEFEEILEESPLLGVKNIAGGVLPDYYLVPAVRDLSDETKTTSTAAFGRLLQRAVSEMTARDPRFLDLQERLGTLVNELNERPTDSDAEPVSELRRLEQAIKNELEAWGVDISIEVTPPEIRKIFELGTELWVDDGHRARAERKGHGLQRGECKIFCVNGYSVYSIKGAILWPSQIPLTS